MSSLNNNTFIMNNNMKDIGNAVHQDFVPKDSLFLHK